MRTYGGRRVGWTPPRARPRHHPEAGELAGRRRDTRYLLDYGPHFYETGIASVNPPVITPPYQDNPANGPIYPSYVPRTDEDGNDIAGVRLVDVTVPLATYTGWALRAGPQANDGCEGSGQMIPFSRTTAARLASGDPRLSIEERYPTYEFFARRVVNAIKAMVGDRLILCEDADNEVARAIAAGVAAGVPADTRGYRPPRICPPPTKN